jgi:hypothetical protein
LYIVLKIGVDGDGVGVGDNDDAGDGIGDVSGGALKLTVLQLSDELNEARNGRVLTSVRA